MCAYMQATYFWFSMQWDERIFVTAVFAATQSKPMILDFGISRVADMKTDGNNFNWLCRNWSGNNGSLETLFVAAFISKSGINCQLTKTCSILPES